MTKKDDITALQDYKNTFVELIKTPEYILYEKINSELNDVINIYESSVQTMAATKEYKEWKQAEKKYKDSDDLLSYKQQEKAYAHYIATPQYEKSQKIEKYYESLKQQWEDTRRIVRTTKEYTKFAEARRSLLSIIPIVSSI